MSQLRARFQGILDRFDDAARAWSELCAHTPHIERQCDVEHLTAVPERYLDMRYHLAELAGSDARAPVEPVLRAAEAPEPQCSRCKLPLKLPPHRGAQTAQGRFWDPGQHLDVIAVACQSCGHLWSVDASAIPAAPAAPTEPVPVVWHSSHVATIAFGALCFGAALGGWFFH